MRIPVSLSLPIAVVAATLAAAAPTEPVDVAEALEPWVDRVIDLVELRTGGRFVRPTLAGVTERAGKVTAIRIIPEGTRGVKSLRISGVVKIIAGRETVYESEADGGGAAGARARLARERYQQRLRESQQRMEAHGVSPWPELSAEEHAREVEALERFLVPVVAAFPKLELTQTHEFLVATDIPPEQMAPYVRSLDAMHDFLCRLYDIPVGEPVWKGKCLVVAFLDEADFTAFEGRFMNTQPQGAHGLCHQRSDGRVIMACYRGNDPAAFAHMLVHETSHGFNHRWLSPARIPSWLNEGLAEWVGTQVVPGSGQVRRKELTAAGYMRQTGRIGDGFFDDRPQAHIQPVQYGIASGLVRFLVSRDRRRFTEFVRAVKEGADVDEAFKTSFNATLDELLQIYGRAVGVPNLSR